MFLPQPFNLLYDRRRTSFVTNQQVIRIFTKHDGQGPHLFFERFKIEVFYNADNFVLLNGRTTIIVKQLLPDWVCKTKFFRGCFIDENTQ